MDVSANDALADALATAHKSVLQLLPGEAPAPSECVVESSSASLDGYRAALLRSERGISGLSAASVQAGQQLLQSVQKLLTASTAAGEAARRSTLAPPRCGSPLILSKRTRLLLARTNGRPSTPAE